jgi:hypothetical protein
MTKGSHSPHYNRPDPGMEEFITHVLYQGHYARGLHLLTEINQLTGGERMCSGRVGSSCSTSGTRLIKSRISFAITDVRATYR